MNKVKSCLTRLNRRIIKNSNKEEEEVVEVDEDVEDVIIPCINRNKGDVEANLSET